MADAAVEFLLNNLKELVLQETHLMNETEGNVGKLKSDLLHLQAFLRETVKMRNSNERIKLMRKEIHDVVYDVEDIIGAYMAKNKVSGKSSVFFKKFLTSHRSVLNFHSIGRKVAGSSGRLEQLRKEINLTTNEEDKTEILSEPRPPRKDMSMVGFADVAERLIRRLTQEADGLDVISLTGMSGLGKTTLAWKIYNDPEIILKFPTRIWLTVSARFTERDIFLRILGHLTTLDDDMRAKDGEELAEIVSNYLQMGTFILVMDDVWSIPAWEQLKKALPLQENKSKVLLTSREETVGSAASKPRPFVPLRAFDPEECWELLRLEALGKLECPPQLVQVGKKIAADCDGLPLAIVVIGGILYELSDSNNVDKTRRNWLKVSMDVNSYLSEKKLDKRMTKFISMSYESLPHYLRPCFLYLGLFPEDYKISASKLIRMWIGEGFIQQEDACIPLEEVGQNYLKALISRNLVNTLKFKADGNVKTCQIHDTLRDFCRIEAATENFLQEIRLNDRGECVPQISVWCRHLSIHSDCKRYISSRSLTPRARSFVCLSKEPYDDLSPKDITNLIKAFRFLRVFEVQPLRFKEIYSGIDSLIHMRYIALSITLAILSPHFDKICNLQTLIINTTSPTLQIKANIWKMKHLSYFKTNASATLPRAKPADCANKLQTLGLISMRSCKGLHKRAPNLKKLGMSGKLALLSEENGPFDSVRQMRYLRKLKLVNDKAQETERLNCLPKVDQFPSGLTSLTLCSTSLKWEEISTLRSLQKLEVLKLKYQACIGHTWELEDAVEGFPSLQFLLIEETDLAFWQAKSHHFPKLRSLVLKHCDKLREIPVDLANVQSFEMLDLTTCTVAVDSARNIAAEKKNILGLDYEFKLSIFPPPTK
ncbi:putative late blight resistance protein homolog R1A-10 isoform X2 [Salvia hispanica]|uniref:putative late blight resistance protein homolog R1A-10 isoform X2 n=1 Tax=Salvia hispanica TaxID=49212 RepID=UPI00200912EE|nr:putative late blight resistance protein homolog R1A-10 isoform X2 [Salvia hispanica]